MERRFRDAGYHITAHQTAHSRAGGEAIRQRLLLALFDLCLARDFHLADVGAAQHSGIRLWRVREEGEYAATDVVLRQGFPQYDAPSCGNLEAHVALLRAAAVERHIAQHAF